MMQLLQSVFTDFGDGFLVATCPNANIAPTYIVRFKDGSIRELTGDQCWDVREAQVRAISEARLTVMGRDREVQAFAQTYQEQFPDTTNWQAPIDGPALAAALAAARKQAAAVKRLFETPPMRPHHINPYLLDWFHLCSARNELELYQLCPAPLQADVSVYRKTIGLSALPADFQPIRKGAIKGDKAQATFGIMGYVRFPKPITPLIPYTFQRVARVRGEHALVEDVFNPQPYKQGGWVEIGNYRLLWALESMGLGVLRYPKKIEGVDTPGPLSLLLAK